QAIDVACRLLVADGIDTIAVEDPSAPQTRAAVVRAGARLVGVPVDADGLRVDELADARAVVVTPAHQFPTGAVLSDARRRELLARGGLVIEDDRGAEHRYDRDAVPALQGAADDRVLYAGSASQALAPGLRLGWLVLPPRLAEAAARLRLELDGGSPALEQLALAQLLETAAFERHLRRARAEYARRRSALGSAIAELLPDASVSGDEAGLHLCLELATPIALADLEARARDSRVRIATPEHYRLAPGPQTSTICVGYAAVQPGAAVAAVHAIRNLLDPAAAAPRERRLRAPMPESAQPTGGSPGDDEIELRVLTFDVREVDEGRMPSIVAAIRAARPDVVALQNAQGRAPAIGRALGFAGLDRARDVISRHRVLRAPNGLHSLVEPLPGRFVALANVHLDAEEYGPAALLAGASRGEVAASERRTRLREVTPVLEALQALATAGVPVVLTGALNAPCQAGWPVADAFAEAGLRDVLGTRVHATWPVPGFATDPGDGSDPIDAILVGGPAATVSAEVLGERGGAGVGIALDDWPSDHRAIVAQLRLTPGALAPFVAAELTSATLGDDLIAVVTRGPAARRGTISLVREGGAPRRALARRSERDVGGDGTLPFATAGLRAGAYDLVLTDRGGHELSRAPLWLASDGAAPWIGVGRRRFARHDAVRVRWRDAPGCRWDWIGIFEAAVDPGRADPVTYRFTGARPSGSVVLEGLAPGSYVAALVYDDTSDVLALERFTVLDR
ncbi:MAG TPA: aminotransferase class I/II-fold pyridoxal phosphate-dependent enzyme, partial [Gaiellales bacterium]